MEIRPYIPECGFYYDFILTRLQMQQFLAILLPPGHPLHLYDDDFFLTEEGFNECFYFPQGVNISQTLLGKDFNSQVETLIDNGQCPEGLDVIDEAYDDHLMVIVKLHEFPLMKKSTAMQICKLVSWQLAAEDYPLIEGY